MSEGEEEDAPGPPRGTLGDYVKALEAPWELTLPMEQPFVARLDGNNFSNFTKPFVKPFDLRLTTAMVETTKDLVTRFNARIGYTQSDEITLVFQRSFPPKSVPLFSGRVVKIASLLAGYASARFNYHLLKGKYLEEEKRLIEHVTGGMAHFDGRVFTTPTPEDATKAVYWRQKIDCYKNSISAFARQHFSTKELHEKHSQEKIRMLKSKGLDWEDETIVLPEFKYGRFVKKFRVEKEDVDRRTGKTVKVVRTKVESESFSMAARFPRMEEKVEYVFRKYANAPDEEEPEEEKPKEEE